MSEQSDSPASLAYKDIITQIMHDLKLTESEAESYLRMSEDLKELYKKHSLYVYTKLKEKFSLTDEETIRYFHMTYEKKVIKNCFNLLNNNLLTHLKKIYPELS